MKIGFLIPSSFAIGNPGNGIAMQAREQASALERRGHNVTLLNPWQWNDEHELDVLHCFLGGLPMYKIHDGLNMKASSILAFSPIIDSNQSFLSYRMASLIGQISSRILTIPSVLRDQAKNADVVICRSQHEQLRIQRGLGIPAHKIERVLNGCMPPAEASRFETPKQSLKTLQLPEEFILHISAFTQPRKNVAKLIDAARQLDVPLVIAGHADEGAALAEFRRIAQRWSKLRLLGFIDSQTKSALYAACKVFCLPSLHEGTGLVALEAAAHGANLVITRNGGPPDYFLDHAEYVDPASTASIRNALARAWKKESDNGLRAHIVKNHTWDRSAATLELIYRKHLELKSRNSGPRE